jgi:hypothetical protein
MITPPFGPRAKAVMSRSISLASRTLVGLASIPSDGAADWMAIPKNGHSSHPRHDLLEHLQPFAAQAVFEHQEAGGIAARARQARNEAGADRVDEARGPPNNGKPTIGACKLASITGQGGEATP